ncbi:hypothetical protein [Saccharomonospora iraqiensis]|uniref:hypothetical protein n=2 Tax=Saccharomonospora TaxID=1851 RepID=UPI0004280532|nr:hypothetical protein [Saccharomonospora iraqiensis]
MTPESFASVQAYNAAYPDCPMPTEPHLRHSLRGYRAAMGGVTDDLTASGESPSAGTSAGLPATATLTVDFLPGGAPFPHEPDRTGTVVATHWGEAPVIVLARRVSLRAAWEAVRRDWPGRLSDVYTAVREATDRPD